MRPAATVVLYGGIWVTATVSAVALSWFGLRDVLAHPVSAPDGPLTPVSASATTTPTTRDADTTSTTTGSGSSSRQNSTTTAQSTAHDAASDSPSGTTSGAERSGTENTRGDEAADVPRATDSDVRTYNVTGGQAVLELDDDEARIVSATPDSGYEVQTWRNDEWVRVDFVGDDHRSTVTAAWNGHPPIVETSQE